MGNQCCNSGSEQVTTNQHSISVKHRFSQKQTTNINNKLQQTVAKVELQSNNIELEVDQVTEGKIDLPNGSKYIGPLKIGVPHGVGTEIHESGDKYIGNFVQGIKEGRGRYEYANGVLYEGEFLNGDIEGQGRMQWPNGDWYKGSFRNNTIHGQGKYYSKWSSSYYEGTYYEGKRNGKGKIISGNSEVDGYWNNGVFKFRQETPIQSH